MSESAELSPEQELAAAFLGGVDEPVEVEAAPEAAPEAQPAVPAATESKEETPPNGWAPREFSFKRNGEEVKLKPSSPEEELEFIRKGFDYTAKTMELAEEKKQIQALAKEIAEREEQRQASMKAFFSNPANVRRYLELLEQNGGPAAPQAPAGDEEYEPVTKADLAKMRQEMLAEARKSANSEAEARMKALLDQAAVERLTADYRSDLDKTIDSLLAKHPELDFVDVAGELIRMAGNRVFQAQLTLNPDQPVDPALVKAAMAEDAAKRAGRTAAKLREREKTEAAAKTTLTTRGVEPPGGNAPSTAPPPSSARPLSLKDPALDAAVIAEIQALMK
jgi:hypothetical protein